MLDPSLRMTTVPAAGAVAARRDSTTPSGLVAPELVVATRTTPPIETASPAAVRTEIRSAKSAHPAAARMTGWPPARIDATAASARPAARYIAPNARVAFARARRTVTRGLGRPDLHEPEGNDDARGRLSRAGPRLRISHEARTAPPITARRPAKRSGAGLGSAA